MKQILVIRRDLKMRRGKEIAQGAHASMKAVLEYMNHEYVKEWLKSDFTKITVEVNSENALIEIYEKALEKELPCSLIIDNGKTEFNGMKTKTVVAVGPGPSVIINEITGNLKLY